MKYNFELDMVTNNSLSMLANKINPNSVVLEFGPAAGRLTKYMSEDLNCDVYIVELDEESAKLASKFAKKTIVGDIESYNWLEEYNDIRFDYIIFADVLEHLKYPQEVLEKTKQLIKSDGSVLLSVPNIAHNSVVIDLINNNFEYRETGLLDDTHLRFFTYTSLLRMIRKSGFVTVNEAAVYKKVEDTEFGNYYNDLPKSVSRYLKEREYSEVYQFIFELKQQDTRVRGQFKDVRIKFNNYFSQIYIDYGSGFNEDQSIIKSNPFTTGPLEFVFDKPLKAIKSLRFDPINENCVLKVTGILIEDDKGKGHFIEKYEHNAEYWFGNVLYFNSSDPQIIIEINDAYAINKIIFDIEIIDYEIDFLTSTYLLMEQEKQKDANCYRSLEECNRLNMELNTVCVSLENLNISYKLEKEALGTIVQSKDDEIILLQSELELMKRQREESEEKHALELELKEKVINMKQLDIDQKDMIINQYSNSILGKFDSLLKRWKKHVKG